MEMMTNTYKEYMELAKNARKAGDWRAAEIYLAIAVAAIA